MQNTDPTGAFGSTSVAATFASVILPILGIFVVLFCLAAFGFRFGAPYRDKVEEIKAFGVDLKVSVLTLFALIGIALSLTGVYFLYRDYERRLADLSTYPERLKHAEEAFNRALAQARQLDVVAYVTLEGTSPNDRPPPSRLKCALFLRETVQERPVDVAPAPYSGTYQLTIKNITRDTFIERLVCTDTTKRSEWSYDRFHPLNPQYALVKKP